MTGEPLLALRRIEKTYASAAGPVAALREVDLSIRAGECVAVTGPSGSGKSTFLSIVGCLDRPTGGAYRLAGCETTGLSARDLSELRRRFIGFVFQSYNLLPRLTAIENVELPLVYARRPSGERRSRALEALDLVGLAAQGARRPAELSGGQQQRVSIARALVTAPGLVVADEPTSALDPETADQIVSLLTDLGGSGITLVMVTHDPGVAARCPRRLVFREGRIVADLAALAPDPPVSSATLANVSLVRHPALGA